MNTHTDSSIASTSHDSRLAPASSPQAAPTKTRAPLPPASPLGAAFLIFGILLPFVTIGFELALRWCGSAFFDPIPSWWHVLLVTAVPAAQRTAAVKWLRVVGSERTLRELCYRRPRLGGPIFGAPGWMSAQDAEANRGLYYRAFGVPFNERPMPASVTLGGQGRGSWNFDAALGGERVADKVPGLTLESSRLDGKVDSTGLTSYTEWTFVFKNVAANASEARAQIELPAGGVVSRLTLWIDGEPREAAFGSRAQVRAAYRANPRLSRLKRRTTLAA